MKRVSVPFVLLLVWLALAWGVDAKLLRPACEECSKLFSLEASISFKEGLQGRTERVSLLLLVVLPWVAYGLFCIPYRAPASWRNWKIALQKWCQPMALFLGAFLLGLFIEYVLYLPVRDHLWDFLRNFIERFQLVLFPLLPGWQSIEVPVHGAGLAGVIYGLYVFLVKAWDPPTSY